MDVKISVIVPVYNVEKTLSRCIDSILNQTFKDMEIILVDDGSTDKSGFICDEYAEQYDFISVIHKENEGLGPTRNIGVFKAKGLYIYHCDSDDWIEPTLLEDSYNNAIANNSDMVIFGYRMFTERKGKLYEYGIVSSQSIFISGEDEIRQYYIDNLNNYFFTQSACNRLVKKEFLTKNNLFFKPYRRGQDVIFSIDLFDKLKRLSILQNHYYNYIIEPGKFKGRSFDETINIYLDIFEGLKNGFIGWNKFTNKVEKMLVRLYFGQIMNFASYYIIEKSDKKIMLLIKNLMNNQRIENLLNSISYENLNSRYLRMCYRAMKKKKRLILLIIFKLHQAKQRVL